MNQLTIVGMGPGSMRFLTMEAYDALTRSPKVYLRTDHHPLVKNLVEKGMVYESYDSFYEDGENFEETYDRIVSHLIEQLSESNLVYAVPGNPFVAEKTVQLLIAHCQKHHISYDVIHGASFLDAMITAMGYDPVLGLSIHDVFQMDQWSEDVKTECIWMQVYNHSIASSLKLHLSEFYGDEHEVYIVRAAGIEGLESIVKVPLYALDYQEYVFDHLTSVWVPQKKELHYDFRDLQRIMKHLRSEEGCPWDREQTHHSITSNLVEEAYEVIEAIENEDDEGMIEELGDVLLQVVFHGVMAEEDGYFTTRDIVRAICEKLVRRHPHVFLQDEGIDSDLKGSEEVLERWDAIKAEEKNHQKTYEVMKSVAKSLPALKRAQKIQKKAAKVGFDWTDLSGALEKIKEEVSELKEAMKLGNPDAVVEEYGDVLLILSHIGNHLKVDSELALNRAVDKFMKRFEYMENKMIEKALEMKAENSDKMEEFWEKAKQNA